MVLQDNRLKRSMRRLSSERNRRTCADPPRLKLAPDEPITHSLLGQWLELLGRKTEAMGEYQMALVTQQPTMMRHKPLLAPSPSPAPPRQVQATGDCQASHAPCDTSRAVCQPCGEIRPALPSSGTAGRTSGWILLNISVRCARLRLKRHLTVFSDTPTTAAASSRLIP
jgi:hypothetical protein